MKKSINEGRGAHPEAIRGFQRRRMQKYAGRLEAAGVIYRIHKGTMLTGESPSGEKFAVYFTVSHASNGETAAWSAIKFYEGDDPNGHGEKYSGWGWEGTAGSFEKGMERAMKPGEAVKDRAKGSRMQASGARPIQQNESLKETRRDNDPSGCSDIEKEAEPCSLHDLVEAWQDEGYSIALVDIASNKVIDPYVDPSDYPGLMFKGCRNGSASTDGKYRIVFHSGQLKAGKDWFSHNESKSYINKMSNGVILDSRELAGMCYTGQVVEQTMNSAAKNDLIRAMKRSGFSEEEFNSHNAADGLTEAHSGSGFFRREPSEFETPGGGPVTKYECPSCHAVFSNKGYLSAKEKYGSGPCPNCRYTPKHRKSEAMRKKRIPKPGYLEKMRKSKEETSVRNESIEMLIAREGFDGLWYLVDSRNNRLGTFKKWEDAEKEAKELGYNVRPEPRSSAPPAIPAKNRRARKPS